MHNGRLRLKQVAKTAFEMRSHGIVWVRASLMRHKPGLCLIILTVGQYDAHELCNEVWKSEALINGSFFPSCCAMRG